MVPDYERMVASDASRTAFVLAGGGSLGAIEVGMLRALFARGVFPDFIVGASVGALNGAFIASDPSVAGVDRLETIWRGLQRDDVFPLSAIGGFLGIFWKRNHLIDPSQLRELVDRNLDFLDLADAPIPLHIVATDVLDGGEVLLSTGSAVDAVLASASIPAVFPPVHIAGRHLVDGGVASNTPIPAAILLGADRVIVLPTGFSCALVEPPRNALAMAIHAVSLMIAHQMIVDIERFGSKVELHVVPPLCPILPSPMDFSLTAELIEGAAGVTEAWLNDGGLERCEIPRQLCPHHHRVART